VTAALLRSCLAAALVGAHLGAFAAPAPAAITFDTTPRPGQHQRLVNDMQATVRMRVEAGPDATDEQRAKVAERMAQMGPMKMSMQMVQTLRVDPPAPDGWLPVAMTLTFPKGEIDVGGQTIPMPQTKSPETSFVARFNPRDFDFDIQKIDGAKELTDALKAQGTKPFTEAFQLFKALREHPLKVGDSVDVPLTMALPMPMPGGAGAMQGQVHYKLTKVERGVAYFDLGMDLKLDINAPMPTPPAAASAPQPEAASAPASEAASAPAPAVPPRSMHILATGSGKGTSALRMADRLQLASHLAMDMQMTMSMPDNGQMFMDMNMQMQSKGESLAKAVPAKKKP
jgi:hypothetical protein